MATDLLLELGFAEPASDAIELARRPLVERLRREMQELNLPFARVTSRSTCHRLAVTVEALAEERQPRVEPIVGPLARVGLDATGRPTPVAERFARKHRSCVSALQVGTWQGRRHLLLQGRAGGLTAQLLPELLERVCAPWLATLQSARRLQDGPDWVVALFGDSVVPLRIGRVSSANKTRIRRGSAWVAVSVPHPWEYPEVLARSGVVFDAGERAARLRVQLNQLRSSARDQLAAPLTELAQAACAVEAPHLMRHELPACASAMPKPVVLAALHQRPGRFAVLSESGELAPYCVEVSDGQSVLGLESSLLASELQELREQLEASLEQPLRERAAQLPMLPLHPGHPSLGNVAEKRMRLVGLTAAIATLLELPADERSALAEAAALCKNDLATPVVRRLPELGGEMGRLCALSQAVDPQVASAIAEHYLPRHATDACPASKLGAVISLADRLDSIVLGCAFNCMPAATSDPLVLRQAAHGLLRVLLERGWDLDVRLLASVAYEQLRALDPDLGETETCRRVDAFVRHRLARLLQRQAVLQHNTQSESLRPVQLAAQPGTG